MSNMTVNQAIVKATQSLKDYVDTNYQPKTDLTLETTDKTIVGAINEILKNGGTGTSTTVIESLTNTVETVQSEVLTIQEIIGAEASGDTPATGLFALLENKADKEAVYTKDEVNDLIGLFATKEDVKEIVDIYLIEKQIESIPDDEYEVSSKPVGTLVDYRDKEIRIMCPSDTSWTLQNSGANADANSYYIGFKAYAPSEDVVSFKEDLAEIIADSTMYSFEGNEFAGIDKYGRKYSIVWLPVANYDGENWTYYGAKSTIDKYIGWYYSVEWFNADNVKVASDTIRINLTNEDCHNSIEPFYMNAINVNKLVQNEGDVLVLNSGTSY